MRAVVYTEAGGPEVLRLVERASPTPGPGEVRVAVRVSGVNPTDWKARSGRAPSGEQVPNQDGAGVIDAVGDGVDPGRVGERVWIWEAAWRRADGTAAQQITLPAGQAVALPDHASFELGASLGIPFLTAHRCLTVRDGAPPRLRPGALSGQSVLVAGGAGAVGNAAIQLARWSGATVISTVSSAEKAALATAAGSDHVVNYREPGAVQAIRAAAPDGVQIVVEVAPSANATLNGEILGGNGVVAIYNTDEEQHDPTIPIERVFALNVRWQGVLVYTMPAEAKAHAVAAVTDAVAAGAVRVGSEAGLPLHHFPLEQSGAAHTAVENNAIGKVLIDVA
jgi:NADPH2:quinone reductase